MYPLYSVFFQYRVLFIVALFGILLFMLPDKGKAFELVKGKPVVFAVYHTNKIVDSAEKLNNKRETLFGTGYELKDRYGDVPYFLLDGHLGFGTKDRTIVGAAYPGNDHYHEWQILLARAGNIDGFIVEWGYNNDNSSPDKALKSHRNILRRLQKNGGNDFFVAPMWLPHWFSGVNTSQIYWENTYRSQINKIMSKYYQGGDGITYEGRPLLFVLDLGISNKSLDRPLLFNFFAENRFEHNPQFIWRMGESHSNSWKQDISLIPEVVGNLPWIVPRENSTTKSNRAFVVDNFEKFGNHRDVLVTIKRLNSLNTKYRHRIPLHVQSVSPGMDTRYSNWNKTKKVLMRSENGINTFELMWDQVLLESYDKPDIVLIETFNDFSEGTHIEPTEAGGFDDIAITAKKSCLLKKDNGVEDYFCDHKKKQARLLACHASKIYKSRKLLSILGKNQGAGSPLLNKSEKIVNSWSASVFEKSISFAELYESRFKTIIKNAPLGMKKIEISDLTYTLSPDVATSEIIVFQKMSSDVSNDSASNAKLSERGDRNYQFKIQLGDRADFLENDYQLSAASITLSRVGEYSDDEKPLEVYQVISGRVDELVAKIYLDKSHHSLNTIISLDSKYSEGTFHQHYKIVNPSYRLELNKLFIENYYSSEYNRPEHGWIEAVTMNRHCAAF